MCFPPKAAPSLSRQPERFAAGSLSETRAFVTVGLQTWKKYGAGEAFFRSLSLSAKHFRSTSVVWFWPGKLWGGRITEEP